MKPTLRGVTLVVLSVMLSTSTCTKVEKPSKEPVVPIERVIWRDRNNPAIISKACLNSGSTVLLCLPKLQKSLNSSNLKAIIYVGLTFETLRAGGLFAKGYLALWVMLP